AEKDANKLSREMNIPIVKACQIVAVGELGRRVYERNQSGFSTIRNAKDAYDYLQDMRNLPKEHLRGLYLNSHNRVIRDEVISIGTINSNMIHPREVFRPAIESNAAAVVLAHNHPSGEATPSEEDIEITKQLVQAGKILGISLLDHVVITKDSFASIQANY
ncbi:MAG: DNA repair protein RadC, partial [Patescibacteria group bacterium]